MRALNQRKPFTMRKRALFGLTCGAFVAGAAYAEQYFLLTGLDVQRYPGSERAVPITPGSGFPGTFFDGDRLAGTADIGPTVVYQGAPPAPFFAPNQFGSLSFLYRRGSVPIGGPNQLPFMGIEFLGGPLLDLDGNLSNGSRSLIPVSGQPPIAIPDSNSFIDLSFDIDAGTVALNEFDATGTNEGGPQAPPQIATIVVVLAGESTAAQPGPAINPTVDTRVGTLIEHSFGGNPVDGVFRVQSLGYELWEDTILNSASTGPFLGTLQYLGRFDGWLIEKQGTSWPNLAGRGLGDTIFPVVNNDLVGQTFNTANGVAGGTATIASGIGGDNFSAAPPNGGLALTDFGADLGAYLDQVVLPIVPAAANRVVFLQSAGVGINNSFDPVFGDTTGYDAVLIAAGTADACGGFIRCDSNCNGVVNVGDIGAFVLALTQGQAAYEQQFPTCSFLCNNDADESGHISVTDIAAFVQCVTGA